MIVIRTFLKGLPVSLEESAMLDGANEIQVLFKIYSAPVQACFGNGGAVGFGGKHGTTGQRPLCMLMSKKLSTHFNM